MTGSAPCAGRFFQPDRVVLTYYSDFTQTLCQVLILIYSYRFERGGPGGRGRTGSSRGSRLADSSRTPDFDECFTFWNHLGVRKGAQNGLQSRPLRNVCTECAQSVAQALSGASPEPLQSFPRASPEPRQSLARASPEPFPRLSRASPELHQASSRAPPEPHQSLDRSCPESRQSFAKAFA